MLHLINYICQREILCHFQFVLGIEFFTNTFKIIFNIFFKKNLNLWMLPHLLHLNDMHWVFLILQVGLLGS